MRAARRTLCLLRPVQISSPLHERDVLSFFVSFNFVQWTRSFKEHQYGAGELSLCSIFLERLL